MKSYDYEAMVYDGEIYCIECLPEGVTTDDADPVFADSEWDYYPVCTECGCVHDCVGLTDEGQRLQAVHNAIEEHKRREFDGLVVSDLSEVPEDYEGEVLLINDHGNVSLYSVEDEECREISSIV